MLKRFQGAEGLPRLEEALLGQAVVEYDRAVAKELAQAVALTKYDVGAAVISQSGTDTQLFFVLSGAVAIEVNGREIATRRAGQHIGEMAMIDPSARRSATVRAKEECVMASVAESVFTPLADKHPRMWRRLAVELGSRLRERGSHVRPTNDKPIVFIGSTAERLATARAIQSACQHDPWVTRVWTDGVFGAGKTPIESLSAQVSTLDFAVLVVTADDLLVSRGAETPSPRDNVVFELGLAMGALGRDRTFMVRLRNERDLKLPTDLLGVKALEITAGADHDLASRVGPAVDEFRKIVKALGCR